MIKITTDSTCDLPKALLEQHNISVTPLGIVKNDRLYRDGIDIRPADIAAHGSRADEANFHGHDDSLSRSCDVCKYILVEAGSDVSGLIGRAP